MKTKFALVILGCLVLAGCISGRPKQETYTDSTGKTTIIQSDGDLCKQSCNDDYSRCMESTDAQDNGGVNGPRGMFGASAECRNTLKDCLPRCKAR